MKPYIFAMLPVVMVFVAGCSTQRTSTPTNNAVTTATNTAVSSNVVSNTTAPLNTTANTASETQEQYAMNQNKQTPFNLMAYTDKTNGYSVKIPSGWSKAPMLGGDWGGMKFVNPNDPNEMVIVATSGCIGCYLNAQGQPTPTQAIPEKNPSNVFVFNNGLSVSYTFIPQQGDPYPGNGVVICSTDKNGYGWAEVILPSTDHDTAAQILDSFQLQL